MVVIVSLQAVHLGLTQSAEQDRLSLYILGSSCDIGRKQNAINNLKKKSKVLYWNPKFFKGRDHNVCPIIHKIVSIVARNILGISTALAFQREENLTVMRRKISKNLAQFDTLTDWRNSE